MLFTLDFVKAIFPDYKGQLTKRSMIHHVMKDSRVKQADSLFMPIIGERFDGHEFLDDAIKHGAIATLWQKNKPVPTNVPDSFVFFLVNDTVEALQRLAATYRNKVNPIVIGVTGSNGKTTTKDLLKSVLQHKYHTYATVGNYNNEIGLPLTLLQMDPRTELVILEMGMNHFYEIDLLTKLARPDYAIITNIGDSHIEFLGSKAGIAKAKLEIINGLDENGMLIIDGDEPLLKNIKKNIPIQSCGFNLENKIHIEPVSISEDKTTFRINDTALFHIPLLGNHHAHNASFVIAVARELGMSDGLIQKGFNELSHSAMRFERIEGKHGVTLINDAYNASLTSMKAAIEVIKELHSYKTKVLVLGDILELGEHSKEFHQYVSEVIDEEIDVVFTIGKDAEEITSALKKDKKAVVSNHFTNKETLIKTLQPYLRKDAIILFKASRSMHLEDVVEACK